MAMIFQYIELQHNIQEQNTLWQSKRWELGTVEDSYKREKDIQSRNWKCIIVYLRRSDWHEGCKMVTSERKYLLINSLPKPISEANIWPK